MKSRWVAAFFLGAVASAGLGACAHADTTVSAPSGVSIAEPQTAPGFPDLRSVPRSSLSNTDQAYWNVVAADVMAAAEALRANPRGQYQPQTEDPRAFLEDAQHDLAATRDSH